MGTYSGDWATWEDTVATGLHGNIQWRLGYIGTYNGDWAAWEHTVATGLLGNIQWRLGCWEHLVCA